MSKIQCTDIFAEVFRSGSGGCVRDCACGRTHFDGSADGGWDWENGEFEDLQAKAKINPEKCFEHDGTVSTMTIGGVEIVYDCPCDTAAKYENFIINHAEKLSEYLRRRAALMREKADKIDVPKQG